MTGQFYKPYSAEHQLANSAGPIMSGVPTYLGKVAEGSGAMILARILGWAGTVITQASLSSIAYKITPVGQAASGSGSVTISSSVFDTLQTSAIWTRDTTGFNFQHALPADEVITLGRNIVEYTFTPASGEPFKVAYSFDVIDTGES